ncbi:uncharacterized protein AB675_4217 [Cyphellophora attinorum]|uniref:AB hydrolase-1 domain-containing protein n=1 Tax=Cyphellophora attinorum TaxID=1664694 RepID=A0A0N1H6Z3_9EURO|nr:uncharacterized protein AB675_4217 [Phialophora attinorum]KPI38610.1 hypothetical protein AB675_4217 [Phialophora attinorum]
MLNYIATSLLIGAASAAAVKRPTYSHGDCHQFAIPIKASSPGAVYKLPVVNNDLTTTAWAVAADCWSSEVREVVENITISGTYSIHAQLCVPTGSNAKDVLQIATHGGHYDKRYWDSEYRPKDHSWRKERHPRRYRGVQTGIELDILRQLTKHAREGTLLSPKDWHMAPSSPPAKIVHLGHSFGSVMTTAFLTNYPNETDGGIITGFAINPYFGLTGMSSWYANYAATTHSPDGPKWDRPSGYVVSQKEGIQVVFFGGDPSTAFTEEQLEYGDKIKQPLPIGELASGAQVLGRPGGGFTGPVQYVLAEFDMFICKGDCKGATNETVLRNTQWPNAADIEVVVQPNTGHAFPLHNNATAGFQLTWDFLERHGL